MSVCKTCRKKYSKWITPVSARGVCGDCFEAELAQEGKAEPQLDVVPELVTAASPSEDNADSLGKKPRPQPPVRVDVLVETLGVALALFGGWILLGWLGPESKSTVTTHGLVARSLTNLGWVLLVICLLNRSGSFHWQLPESKKAWFMEFRWGAILLVTSMLAKIIVARIGREMHLTSGPTAWSEALRHPSTWIAF